MNDLEKVIGNLRADLEQIAGYQAQKVRALNSGRSLAERDEDARRLDAEIKRLEDRMATDLVKFAHFPHWHIRHAQLLEEFKKNGDYEDSVFIMTKYPDPNSPAVTDPELMQVIETVKAAVKAAAYEPRVASDQDYHMQLWDNVELHMLGCRRGIAVVQDKVKAELNPNVAIEWGWMLGLDRKVLYLVEKDFKQERADWKGMSSSEFDWANPAPGIEAAVKKFLPPKPPKP